MLLSALKNFSDNPAMAFVSILLMIPTVLISLTVHEYSHGRMSLALGDKTALMSGRLSLNPIKHLDPFGTIMLLLFGFGFAKPVPINTRNFNKVSYKTGIVLVSLAGPVSNFLLAFLGVLGIHITILINQVTHNISTALQLTNIFFYYFAIMNIGLGVFNLIPLPPLDGSRLLTVFLPTKAQMWFYRYEQYIQIVIFILLWMGVFDVPLIFIRNAIFTLMNNLISLIPFLS